MRDISPYPPLHSLRTSPLSLSGSEMEDEPIKTQTVYLTTSAISPYLSLACAAYGTVWRTAQIVRPQPAIAQKPNSTSILDDTAITTTSVVAKDKVLFSYESNPAFFLQSGSIITSTTPGFSLPKSPTLGGHRTVKLTMEEVGSVHGMLMSVWLGMVEEPQSDSFTTLKSTVRGDLA